MRKVLFFVLLLLMAQAVSGQERIVETSKRFRVNRDARVDVTGKYSNIHIETYNGSEVAVNVQVKVRASSMKEVEKMLDKIEVDIAGNSKQVTVESALPAIKNWNQSGKRGDIRITFKDGTEVRLQEFSIDYALRIPYTNHIRLDNKYGDIFVDELEGDADIQLKYGTLETEALKGRCLLNLSYAKANIEAVNWGDMEIKYSELKLEVARAIRLESRYSNFEIERIDTLRSISRYNGYQLGEVSYFVAEERNSTIQLERLNKIGDFEMRYGGLEVGWLSAGFRLFRFDGQYAGCELRTEKGADYTFDIHTKYANVLKPAGAKVQEDLKERSERRLIGYVGSASANSRIEIRSEYGDVTIK